MPRLPDKYALGERDPRASRGVPNFPTDSPVGDAIARGGATVARIGFSEAAEQRQQADRAEAFGVQTRELQLDNNWRTAFEERWRNIKPGAAGFADTTRTDIRKSLDEFFKTVPNHLKPAYGPRLVEMENRFYETARKRELQERDRYSLEQAGEGQKALLGRLNGDFTTAEKIAAEGDALLDNSGLSAPEIEAQKVRWRDVVKAEGGKAFEQRLATLQDEALADPKNRETNLVAADARVDEAVAKGYLDAARGMALKDAWRQNYSVRLLKSMSPEERAAALGRSGGISGGTATQMAASLLRREEGFRETPYWDVNAHRVGYGSDTITRPDGSVERVTTGSRVSRADADRDLERRITQEFGPKAAEAVGPDWNKLSPGAQAALISVTYNYGKLPASVAVIAREGDKEKLAAAVAGLGSNPDRRKREAMLILSGSGASAEDGQSSGGDPFFTKNLPPDVLAALREQTRVDLRQEAALEEQRTDEVKEEVTKQGYDMMLEDELAPPDAPPSLTREWVESNRDVLNTSDYKAFLKTFEPETTAKRTPPQEYLRLLDLADADPQEAIDEARTLYGNDVIAKEVFNTVTSRARENQKRAGGRSFASELRTYLSTSMTPERDAPQWQYARKLDAQFSFDDFVKANPDADRETLRKAANTIVEDYKRIRYGQGVTELPLPKYVAPKNAANLEMDDLQKAMNLTLNDVLAKKLTEREAAEQASIIRRWVDILKFREGK